MKTITVILKQGGKGSFNEKLKAALIEQHGHLPPGDYDVQVEFEEDDENKDGN